jgi:hypothetical protein
MALVRSARDPGTLFKAHRFKRQAVCLLEGYAKKGRLAMPLINVVFALIVVGVLLWLINNYLPMDGKIKSILNGVVVIAVVLWLLQVFGVLGSVSSFRV